MEFKIDTKASYTHIAPLYAHMDAIMAASLTEKCTELAAAGSQNFLIDLKACQDGTAEAFHELADLHEECYMSGHSLVFTGLQEGVLKAAREAEMDEVLNIAPTEIEAIDLISMEILERDLFDEES